MFVKYKNENAIIKIQKSFASKTLFSFKSFGKIVTIAISFILD